jgi:hypothetical protein
LAGAGGKASAATSNDCDVATSTRVPSADTDAPDQVWIDSPSDTKTLVCVRTPSLNIGGLTVIADTGPGATPPSVDVGGDAALSARTRFSP